MLKYISETSDRLSKLKDGIVKNPGTWTNQAVTPESIQTQIDGLNSIGKAVEDLQSQASSKLAEARALQKAADKEAASIENLAIGLEKGDPAKLNEYGIKLKKAPAKKTVPVDVLQVTLQDDTDGEGFIVTASYDASADMYEWEKGKADDPTKTDVIPELKFFKATKKTTYVDDDVVKGVRYFYRVRATNTAGAGPWSEAVSRVQ